MTTAPRAVTGPTRTGRHLVAVGAAGSDLRARRMLDRLIAEVHAGKGRAVLLSGEAGISKAALLDHLSAQVEGWRVIRAAGVEPERELAFAAVHQVCAPVLDELTRLPAPRQETLAVAFGQRAGSPPDLFMAGLAVLGLLAEAAREQPLLCLIDDAQWLDRESAQVLGFAARRLRSEPVAMIFAVRGNREHASVPELAGLFEVNVTGLPDEDARTLLAAAIGRPVPQRGDSGAGRLTAQEAQVARLARDGLSNTEIGARLSISPRTVEWHLGKIFAKLGITSRRQLRITAPPSGGPPRRAVAP